MGCANAKDEKRLNEKNRVKNHSDTIDVLKRYVLEKNDVPEKIDVPEKVSNRNAFARSDFIRKVRYFQDENLNPGEESAFDPSVLQDSWGALRGGASNKSRNNRMRRRRRRGLMRDSTLNKSDEASDLEKLLPKLIEGFQKGISFAEESSGKKLKRRKTKSKVRIHDRRSALAGLSALDLLVKSADDPDRLGAVCDHMGKGLKNWMLDSDKGKDKDQDKDKDMAELVIEENLRAVKIAVLFLLQSNLKSRQFDDRVKLTWTKFIDSCCERILRNHQLSLEVSKEQSGHLQLFSDAAKTFAGEHIWLILSVGYQIGSYLWRYSQSRATPSVESSYPESRNQSEGANTGWVSSAPANTTRFPSVPTYRGGASSDPTYGGGASSDPTYRGGASSEPVHRGGASSDLAYRGGASSYPDSRSGASSDPVYADGTYSSSGIANRVVSASTRDGRIFPIQVPLNHRQANVCVELKVKDNEEIQRR